MRLDFWVLGESVRVFIGEDCPQGPKGHENRWIGTYILRNNIINIKVQGPEKQGGIRKNK